MLTLQAMERVLAVMPLDVLGRTVRTCHFTHHRLRSLANVSIARYTDRANEFITLAGRSG